MELQKSELLSVAVNALVVANQIRDKAVASESLNIGLNGITVCLHVT